MANLRELFSARSPLFSSPNAKRKTIIWGVTGLTVLIVIIVIIVVVSTDVARAQTGRDALKVTPLIDGHNDLPFNLRNLLKNNLTQFSFEDLSDTVYWNNCKTCQTDLKKLRKGLVGAQFWSAYAPCTKIDPVQETLEQIDVIHRLVKKYKKDLVFVRSSDGIRAAFNEGKIASLIGVEGGHSIDSRLGILRTYYDLGVRYMTLTHTCDTPWASSCTNNKGDKNLTEFGKHVVLEMNRLGMMVDLSHVSDGVMYDAIEISRAPIIFSHSSARTLCNIPRNVDDAVLMQLKDNGGIIMINFDKEFICPISNETVDIAGVMGHINYIADKIGVDHVGIGADYDGFGEAPKGLEDVSKFPELFDMLYANDSTMWSINNLKKLAGENLLRVFSKVEEIRESLINEEPYQIWISEKEFDEYPECRSKEDVEEIVTEPPIETSTTTAFISTSTNLETTSNEITSTVVTSKSTNKNTKTTSTATTEKDLSKDKFH